MDKIVNSNNHFCIALKGNQPKLHKLAICVHREHGAAESYSEIQRQRGRYEERYYDLLPLQDITLNAEQQSLLANWKHLRCIIKVLRRRTIKSEVSEETHYYISNLKLPVAEFANGIRNHWAIENRLHWIKDGFFREDDLKLKSDTAATNIAHMCSMVIGILNRGAPGTNFKERTRYFINRVDRTLKALDLDTLLKIK